MAKLLYYAIDGQKYGPVTLEELKHLVVTDALPQSGYVFNDQILQWVLVSEIPSLNTVRHSPPQLPHSPSADLLDQLAQHLSLNESTPARPQGKRKNPSQPLSVGNWIGVGIGGILLLWLLGGFLLRGIASESNFDAIHIGMTQDDVVKLMGRPNSETFTGDLQTVYIYYSSDDKHEFVVIFDFDRTYTDVRVVVDKQRRLR